LSLEQAIPRVIIAVILIQFSYLLGETLLFIANESNFEPIFRYIFDVPQGGWTTFVAGIGALSPTILLGVTLIRVPFLGQAILIGMLIFGLWYLWRLLVLWWHNLSVVLLICAFTMASPIIIAFSLLPGEAGAMQTRRYFSTLMSLLSRTFLLQLISISPTILVWSYSSSGVLGGSLTPALSLIPVILSIIILGYADNVQNLANQFAKNLTGADPIGGQAQGR